MQECRPFIWMFVRRNEEMERDGGMERNGERQGELPGTDTLIPRSTRATHAFACIKRADEPDAMLVAQSFDADDVINTTHVSTVFHCSMCNIDWPGADGLFVESLFPSSNRDQWARVLNAI